LQRTDNQSRYQDWQNRWHTSRYSFTRFSLGHGLGSYEALLNWSPEGRRYGRGGAKVWFELDASSF